MSRKKLVAYIRPEEPKFLRELKEQIKYKEGPTIDTKKEVLPHVSDDETEDLDGEKPLVVVLNSGDLTAEEAENFEKRKQEEEAIEEATAPADLSKRIIFSKNKLKNKSSNSTEEPAAKKIKKNKQKKAVLSFNDEDEENVG